VIAHRAEPNEVERLAVFAAKAVKEVLSSNQRVWVYPVSTLFGRKVSGFVAFSRDYLQETIAERLAADDGFKAIPDGARWIQSGLPAEIETVLNRHKVCRGYALLAGTNRPVWVMPLTEIKLSKGKSLKSPPVEVIERI
jgi:hypothetical protein